MQNSISIYSLGTIDTNSAVTNPSRKTRGTINVPIKIPKKLCGEFLWRGFIGKITKSIMMLPWCMWWQIFVICTILVTYFTLFFDYDKLIGCWYLVILSATEIVFLIDVTIYLLHAFWPVLRTYMRAYRRNPLLLLYDTFSLVPLRYFEYFGIYYIEMDIFGKLFVAFRVYRVIRFIRNINEVMFTSRKSLYLLDHAVSVVMLLHGCTCIWYGLRNDSTDYTFWQEHGYQVPIGSESITFGRYDTCWYYCACRFYSTIFGDSYPDSDLEIWMTTLLMLGSCMLFQYRIIGILAWEFVKDTSRFITFVDEYRHMLKYLTFRGVPKRLIDEAKTYKLTLWAMKDGVLSTNYLKKLPLSLQRELIFDINVGYFHNSLLLKNTDEACIRQISLYMQHEIFLPGQNIWSQGVVKCGMICVKNGVIEMLSDEDDESPMISFTQGTVLGELSLFYSIPAKVTVKAATYVELQTLKRTDFMKAVSEQTLIMEEIRRKMLSRLNKARTRELAITKYDRGDARLIRTRYRPMKVLKEHLAGVQGEDPTFIDNSHMFYKDENNERKPKFTGEYLELYKLSENVSNINAPKICWRASFPWILEPDTDFTRLCDLVHYLTVLYLCIVLPYYEILAFTKMYFVKIMNSIFYSILILNIYLQLSTAIVKKNVRKVTFNQIIEDKMSTVGFYLDIISVFPLYIFSNAFDPHGETALGQVACITPIIQVWHIWDYMSKWEKSFSANAKCICLMKFLIIFCLMSYWGGSLMYLFSCPRMICRKNTWLKELTYRETKVYLTPNAKHEKIALTTFLFGTSIVTGAGISDISPGKNGILMVVFLIIVGNYIKCFYTAKICSLYILSTQRRLKFKESMRELFYFLSANQVTLKIRKRVQKFFCVQWYYNKGVSTEDLFKDISSTIQHDVLSMELVGTLQTCPLFQNCSKDFLQTVATKTRSIVLPDSEVVQRTCDIDRNMYILQKGHCNISDNAGVTVATISPGENFGAIEMFFGLPKVYTVMTTTNCVLLYLDYQVLVQCLSAFPEVSTPINVVLQDSELREKASKFESIKALSSKIDTRSNRIAQELKESFVLSNRNSSSEYNKPFDKLGIFRYIKYIILPLSITPYGIFLKLWCFLRFIFAMYYIFTGPYNIATRSSAHGGVPYLMDIGLYLDIIVMSYVAYYNKNNVLITHPLYTISRYLRNGFFIDFLTVLPVEIIVSIFNSQIDTDICRINRLLQVTRILSAFSFWESNIMQVNKFVVLMKFIPIVIVIVNLATSYLFYNACDTFLSEGSRVILVNCSRSFISNSTNYTGPMTATLEYVYTFFWTFSIFLGSGCLPLSPITDSDMVVVMILEILGILYFAFMYGYVACSSSTSATNALLDHMEKTKDLENFLYQQNVDPMLTMKTVKYFEYIWRRTSGSNPQQICRRLNAALMEDTLVFMYEKTLREVPLFGNVERSFIRVIIQHLHEMYFLKGETVIQCRDVQPYIYIIYRGKVDVFSFYNEMITCMGPGGMFGNFTGQTVSCSEVSVCASRSLDLLVIPSQTFFNLAKFYPKIQEPLKKAFEQSKDYILPITMDINIEYSSSESETISNESFTFATKNETDLSVSTRSSHSSMSRSDRSTTASIILSQSNFKFYQVFRPGTRMYLIVGYVSCFMSTLSYCLNSYSLVTLNDCIVILWINYILDVFFYIRLYLMMHQGYSNKYGDITTDFTKCRQKYFKNKWRLWSDILVNMPYALFGIAFSNPMKTMHYLRLVKLLRLKHLVEFYRETAAELTNNLTTLQTVMVVSIIIILVHTYTCMWLVIIVTTSPYKALSLAKISNADKYNGLNNDKWDYSSALYIVACELTSTGGDEYEIHGLAQMAIMALCKISGKILAAVCIATAIQVAYSSKHALTKYGDESKQLIDVLKNQGLSRYQLQKFWKYIKQLWSNERGRQLPALLSETPYVRRCDLMSAMFGQYLRGSYLFCNTGEAFLRQLAAVMSYTVFFPSNYIVVAGDSDACMHWVISGSVSVVSVRADLTETTYEVLGPGDVFGIMQGVNKGIAHCFSYRAETKVTIVTLTLDTWIEILAFFPEAKKNIIERADRLFSLV